MSSENGLWYVTNFLSINDVLHLTSTCTFLNNDQDIWYYYYCYYKSRLNVNQYKFFTKLNLVLYGSYKKTLMAYSIYKSWSTLSITDQFDCFSNRNVILLFLIALKIKYGKEAVYEYNNYLQHTRKSNRIFWICSSWKVLKCSKNNFFRHTYLSVY
jgi:acetyltransferase-like isoleucine patch superfamily enzyme